MIEVRRIFEEIKSVEQLIEGTGDISSLNSFRSTGSKSLLMSAASYFERRICDHILNYSRSNSTSTIIHNFIDNQALKRKYHTLFQWKSGNINSFYGLFGREFLDWIKREEEREEIKESARTFLEIGNLRNQLVHENFATYNLNDTYTEVWEKFQNALTFVEWLPKKFAEFSSIASVKDAKKVQKE